MGNRRTNTTWAVDLICSDFDGDDTTYVYGPFRLRETADTFVTKVKERLPDMDGEDGAIFCHVRPIREPRIMNAVKEARAHKQGLIEHRKSVSTTGEW